MTSKLLESVIPLELGAQEPWPNDVKLFQPYAMEQILLPDNANCLAVQAFLRMCGLPFEIEQRANSEFMSPSGKVPFIKCGAFVVSELEPIVQFVAKKGITLTEKLDQEQKSDMRAYMSIIHTVLVNAELYICWCDDQTYNDVTKPRYGSVYPWPLNVYQTWMKQHSITKKLRVLGWYQKSLESVYQEVDNCCQALSERLDNKEYFFGSKPCELDAFVFGHISAILSTPYICTNLSSIIMRYPNLVMLYQKISMKIMKQNTDNNNTTLTVSGHDLTFENDMSKLDDIDDLDDLDEISIINLDDNSSDCMSDIYVIEDNELESESAESIEAIDLNESLDDKEFMPNEDGKEDLQDSDTSVDEQLFTECTSSVSVSKQRKYSKTPGLGGLYGRPVEIDGAESFVSINSLTETEKEFKK